MEIAQTVAALEERAEKLRSLLGFAPRPFVIEFAGTPKSGKSTSVEAVRHFLNRHGFNVHLLAERAAVCPIPMKGHLFFNTWCATSMLAELLANIETETDVVIVDRGIFDALVWLNLQEKRGELTGDEARTIEKFLLLDRWRKLIDLVVVMNVSAEEAVQRENRQRITQKPGSIMNPDVLGAITQAVDRAVERYSKQFAVMRHATAGEGVRDSSVRLADGLLASLEEFLNPEVLVVPRKEIQRLPIKNGGSFEESAFRDAMGCIEKYSSFMRRAEAEVRNDMVQIVSSGVLVREDKIFVFQRKENDPKYRLYGKATIWQGAHVAKDEGFHVPQLIEHALQERVSRSLFLSRVFAIKDLGYCWDATDARSSRHFGLIYRIDIDNPHTAVDLRKKEFRRRRGHGLVGQFVPQDDLLKNQDDLNLEPWSMAILRGRKVVG